MAHIPVPVPTSKTFCGFSSGARKSLLSNARYSTWWLSIPVSSDGEKQFGLEVYVMSRPSFCLSSLGALWMHQRLPACREGGRVAEDVYTSTRRL